MDFPENPNLNPNCMHLADGDPLSLDFELSEYLMLDDSTSQSLASSEKTYHVVDAGCGGSTGATSRNNNMQVIYLLYIYDSVFFFIFCFLFI